MVKPEIHMSAGLGGRIPFISSGVRTLDKLMDNMSPEWDAHFHYHQDMYEDAYEAIMDRVQSEGQFPTIILGGHSMGVLEAIKVAWRLNGVGVPVHYLFAIDATALSSRLKREVPTRKMTVPMNVKEVDEFWSHWGLFNFPWYARRASPDGSRGGKLVYTKAWRSQNKRRIYEVAAGHIPIASHRTTRSIIIKGVENAIAR